MDANKLLRDHYINHGKQSEPLILEPEDWTEDEWKVILKLFGMQKADRIKVSDYILETYGIHSETIRKQIIVKTKNKEEEMRIAEKIHYQLVGNQDYIDCGIVLNISDDRNDGTKNEVHLYIFDDSKTDPEIKI